MWAVGPAPPCDFPRPLEQLRIRRPLETQRAILRRAFDLGINHFDLANNYGRPPARPSRTSGASYASDFVPYRDELILSTKAGFDMWPGPFGEWGSRKYLLASLDQSLKRMGVDYVDIFYSHRPDPETPIEETARALAQMVRQGKALYVGVSSIARRARGSCTNCLRPRKSSCNSSAFLFHVQPMDRGGRAARCSA